MFLSRMTITHIGADGPTNGENETVPTSLGTIVRFCHFDYFDFDYKNPNESKPHTKRCVGTNL